MIVAQLTAAMDGAVALVAAGVRPSAWVVPGIVLIVAVLVLPPVIRLVTRFFGRDPDAQ